jgi:hypothetical protein
MEVFGPKCYFAIFGEVVVRFAVEVTEAKDRPAVVVASDDEAADPFRVGHDTFRTPPGSTGFFHLGELSDPVGDGRHTFLRRPLPPMKKLSITFRVSARLLWVKEIDGRLTLCGLPNGLVWRQNMTLYGLRQPPLLGDVWRPRDHP